MFMHLVKYAGGSLLRDRDDPSVAGASVGDEVLVTTSDAAVYMKVVAVSTFTSGLAAWSSMGEQVIHGSDGLWTASRVRLYLSRFYRPVREQCQPSVVLGLRLVTRSCREAEDVRRVYRACGYPWPFDAHVPRPEHHWRAPVAMPEAQPDGG